MREKVTKEKDKQEAECEGSQGFAGMCGQMMSAETPGCCGPEMRGMMSRWMAGFQAKEEK
jgi:hypothetical protein